MYVSGHLHDYLAMLPRNEIVRAGSRGTHERAIIVGCVAGM
jgi:hypothetical protein